MRSFSIILPVRNGGAYVKECIQSILHQTYNDFNCIVLDNCSTDGTTEWLKSIVDNRLIIIPSEKPSTIEENWARIRGIEKKEFMTMIGHDDVLAAHYLAEMNALIDRHPNASLYQSHFSYIDSNGAFTRDCLPMDEVQKAHEFLASQMNDTINSTGTGYVMRSADYDTAGGIPTNYPNLIFADYDLWIRLTSLTYKATSFSKCFYYREHMSMSRATDGEKYASAFHEYVSFLHGLKYEDVTFAETIERYGLLFLNKLCESLSHRLLKTPELVRQSSVKNLIDRFNGYAQLLIPGAVFDPMSFPRIKYAHWLDQTTFTRKAFRAVNKLLR